MHQREKKLPVKDKLRSFLRKAGFKSTPARLAILSVIKEVKNPLSAQEIIEQLGNKFDKVTVYRFMKKLRERGIIRQIDLRQNHAHFELFDPNDHHHLVCVRCGKIRDIIGCEVENMYKNILDSATGFSEIRQHSLEFYGICNICSKVSSRK